jgi:hypothetical protein
MGLMVARKENGIGHGRGKKGKEKKKKEGLRVLWLKENDNDQ